MLNINEINYPSFGRCLLISNGRIELVVTLDFGPRIIRAAFVGEDNFMFEDTDRQYRNEDAWNDRTFYIYGGHRLWVAPETTPDTYYPDNEPVEYSVSGNTVTLVPPVQSTGFGLRIDITMSETEDKVSLRHFVTNKGNEVRRVAPWAVTVLANGGHLMIPVNNNDTGCLPNRYVVLWPYAKMNDPRIDWGDKFIVLDQTDARTSDMNGAFKIGTSQLQPWAVYVRGDSMFMKRYTFYPDGEYPDGNCSVEAYSCPGYVEFETLGVYRELNPGESAVHDEVWCLFDKAGIDL